MTSITFEINSDRLDGYTDEYLVQLWHISQANPAPFGDRQACELTERVGREIIRRFVSNQPPALWNHQGRHVLTQVRIAAAYAAPSVEDIIERLQAQVQPGEVITLDDATSLLNLPDEPGMQGRLTTALRCAGFTRDRFGDLRLWAWKAPTAVAQQQSNSPASSIDDELLRLVAPGEALETMTIMDRLGLPYTPTDEGALRGALRRQGFTRARQPYGKRLSVWVRPLSSDHRECRSTPLPERDTPPSPSLASHPQSDAFAHPQQDSQTPAGQPEQTYQRSHEFATSPTPSHSENASLASTQGGAA